MAKVFNWVGDNLSRLNAIAWAWTLVPSTLVAAFVSWGARVSALPMWLHAVIFIGVLALCSITIAAFRWHRSTSIKDAATAELEKRVYDETLARLTGEASAQRQHRQDEAFRSFGAKGIADSIVQSAEVQRAKHLGKIARLERGE